MGRANKKKRRQPRRARTTEPVAAPEPTRPQWLVAAAVTTVAFAIFAATVCPTVLFGDSGELIAAADSFGVAHPPGYPLYTMLGWLVLQLPFGEPALRMNLMSALFGALACGAIAWLVRAQTERAAAALAAGLGLAVSSAFWSVSTAAEVYTLHLFLAAVMLCGAHQVGRSPDPSTRARALMVAGCALGLGLAHHPTIVLVVPSAALLAARFNLTSSERSEAKGLLRLLPAVRTPTLLLAVALVVALPAALDLSLMFRARLGPASNWGNVTTLPRLMVHVTAAAYRQLDLGWAGLMRGIAWRQLGGFIVEQFTPVILPLAALGFAGLAGTKRRASPSSRAAAALLVVAGVLFGLRFATEDAEVYYLPILLGLAIAGGLGLGLLLHHRRKELRAAGWLLALLLPLLPAVTHFASHDLRSTTAAADYATDILEGVPQRGILFVEGDDANGVLYLHQVLGKRSDVTIYNRSGILYRNLAEEVFLAGKPGESMESYRARLEQLFIDRTLAPLRHREILFLATPGYEVSRQQRLDAFGLLYRVRRADDPMWDDTALWAGYHEKSIRQQAEQLGSTIALAAAASYPIARGEKKLALGDHAAAVEAFEAASQLASRSSGVHNYIGTQYGRAGDYPRAIESFERAVRIQTSNTLAWRNLAVACEQDGKIDRAREAWAQLVQLTLWPDEARAQLRRLGGEKH